MMRIGDEIDHQKTLLRERFLDLKHTTKENRLLGRVVDDYQRYYDHIRKQKEDQREALRLVSEYLTDVTATSQLTESLLREAKHDQTATLEEMEHIQKDIDKLIGADAPGPRHAEGARPGRNVF